jgi:hypothetical protein
MESHWHAIGVRFNAKYERHRPNDRRTEQKIIGLIIIGSCAFVAIGIWMFSLIAFTHGEPSNAAAPFEIAPLSQ